MNPRDDGIVLVEDPAVEDLGPIVLLRAACDLVAGAFTLRERVARVSGRAIAGVQRRAAPDWGGRERRLCINAACVLDSESWAEIRSLAPGKVLVTADWRFLAGELEPDDLLSVTASTASTFLARAEGTVEVAKTVRLLRHWPDLISEHERLLGADIREAIENADARPVHSSADRGILVEGEGVFAEEDVRIQGPVSIDAAAGPVWLRRGSRLGPFTRLEGPVVVGEGTQVPGGRVAQTYLGPGCLARGEIASSVLLGMSNKAHDGFLGHSYLGEWVNLGAMTTTSNLKNNYGEVRVTVGGRTVPSGREKLGSLIGDHTKTAIGSLLATGSTIGMGVNLFGAAGLAPRWLPSFVWGAGPRPVEHELARCLATAERVVARRGRTLSELQREAIARAFEVTAAERRRFLRNERT
jgi:UDP-N-acetylglucosamine diphosphorylase/glucosamine-1-phosphate N-acetyltransferase